VRCAGIPPFAEGRGAGAGPLAVWGEFLPSFYLADTPGFEHWLENERAKLRRAAVEAAAAWPQPGSQLPSICRNSSIQFRMIRVSEAGGACRNRKLCPSGMTS